MKNYIVLCVLGGLLVACGSEPKKETDSEPKTIVKEVVVVKEVERPSVAPTPTGTTSTPTPQPTQTATLPPAEEPTKTPKQKMQEDKDELAKLKRVFDDQLAVVLKTPRINLSPEIGKLQEARRAYASHQADKCFDLSKQKLVAGMDVAINTVNEFRNDGDLGVIVIEQAIIKYKELFRDYEHLTGQCVAYASDKL